MKDPRGNWIWIGSLNAQEREEPMQVLFRKTIYPDDVPRSLVIHITADSRYKLYVNGAFVQAGPSKGDDQVWFFDTADIAPFLRSGENVIAVRVLRYPMDHNKGCHGIFRTEHPGLLVQSADGDTEIDTDETWKVKKYDAFEIVPESPYFAPLRIYERTAGDADTAGWMLPGYDDSSWENAVHDYAFSLQNSPGNLFARTIPYLYQKPGRFEEVVTVRSSASGEADWNAFLKGEAKITIAPHTKEVVEISAGMIKTAYLYFKAEQGAGSRVELDQAESYVLPEMFGEYHRKGIRTDFENGVIDGFKDSYTVCGYGTADAPEVYEPFWFRCFRFIKLTIETADEPLTLSGLDYCETGYPLEVKTTAETSDPALSDIWDMSLRTLRLCMHETYEDCPFYEQLQYAMDSRAQILFTYTVSSDDRLARKCMDDFKRSQRYDGLINSSYPNFGSNVIPGFSIFYILMVYDHMMYFGDRELLEEHYPAIERVLRFFHTHLTKEGYVEKIGGLNGPDRFWSFIDWAPEWNDTNGVPSVTMEGPITMESLLYIYGLQHTVRIADYLGRTQDALRYDAEAKAVQKAVLTYCRGENGMLQDGPGKEVYSQHPQVFGILTETLDPQTGRKNLAQTVAHKEIYPQCSVAMSFYLFRALQETGLYESTKEYWKIWTRMLERGALTCVENDVEERSDCHAWGALILYELPSVILGVKPAAPGYAAVEIRPEAGYLKSAKGRVITPNGPVSVEWTKDENGKLQVSYEAPENITVIC